MVANCTYVPPNTASDAGVAGIGVSLTKIL